MRDRAAWTAPERPEPASPPSDEMLLQIIELKKDVAQLAAIVSRPAPTGDAGRWAIMLSAFQALGYALSARALLLLSLIGAFVLAMRAPDTMHLLTLGVYAMFTVVPVVVLEVRKHRPETSE